MEQGKRRVLGGLAAGAVVIGVLVPAGAAFAADYPPEVLPTTVTRDTGATAPAAANTGANAGAQAAQVQGAEVSRGSLPFTGGDIAGIAAIGGGAIVIGGLMVRRSRVRRSES